MTEKAKYAYNQIKAQIDIFIRNLSDEEYEDVLDELETEVEARSQALTTSIRKSKKENEE